MLKQKRIDEKMGAQGHMDITFGSIGAVMGGFFGSGVFSGIGVVVGGSSGFLAGKGLSQAKRNDLTRISNTIEYHLLEK